jgi:hypothetical protein
MNVYECTDFALFNLHHQSQVKYHSCSEESENIHGMNDLLQDVFVL